MRHASFIPAGTKSLPRFDRTAPASIHSPTQTPFIAGPLWFMLGAKKLDCQPSFLNYIMKDNFLISISFQKRAEI